MTIRYIIRPQGMLTTPRLLKETLGAVRTLVRAHARRKPSLRKDFFLSYPPIQELEEYALVPYNQRETIVAMAERGECQRSGNTLESLAAYHRARSFSIASKAAQRGLLANTPESLADGFPSPATATRLTTDTNGTTCAEFSSDGGRTYVYVHPVLGNGESSSGLRYVVRPLKHYGGLHYRITHNPCDFRPGQEYISELYEKDHEFRIILVRGEPLITMYKRTPNGLDNSQPWNHSNGSRFETVRDLSSSRLQHTDVFERIRASKLLKVFDLCALDILYKRGGDYKVCELNLCPAITLPENLEKVKAHVYQNH